MIWSVLVQRILCNGSVRSGSQALVSQSMEQNFRFAQLLRIRNLIHQSPNMAALPQPCSESAEQHYRVIRPLRHSHHRLLKALQAYSGLLSAGLVSRIGHRHRICPSCRFCPSTNMPVVLLTLVKGSERDDSALYAVIGLALRPLTGQNHPFPTLSLVRKAST